jgi:hypothetical protein
MRIRTPDEATTSQPRLIDVHRASYEARVIARAKRLNAIAKKAYHTRGWLMAHRDDLVAQIEAAEVRLAVAVQREDMLSDQAAAFKTELVGRVSEEAYNQISE